METELLFYEDAYLKEFTAAVETAEEGGVVLDRTAFYPRGGGQPGDSGVLEAAGEEYRVWDTAKDGDRVLHLVAGPLLPVGTEVRGRVDWDRRYLFMRSHTALHVLNGVMQKELDNTVISVQIGEERTRAELQVEGLSRDDAERFCRLSTQAAAADLPVSAEFLPARVIQADAALARNFKLTPKSPEELFRVLHVGDLDARTCAGLHVRGTGEIGAMELVKFDNKGKARKHLYFRLTG